MVPCFGFNSAGQFAQGQPRVPCRWTLWLVGSARLSQTIQFREDDLAGQTKVDPMIILAALASEPQVPLKCAALLFDMDGVLVNSTPAVERQWRSWVRDHGLSPEHVPIQHGKRTVDQVREAAPHLDAAAEAHRIELCEEQDTDGIEVYPSVARLLGMLLPEEWAVVTSAHRRLAEARLSGVGIDIPPILVTADDVVSGKPDPEGYLHAASRLEVAPEAAVVVEDAPSGITAARAAGMTVIAITTTHSADELGAADFITSHLERLDVTRAPGPGLPLQVSVTFSTS